ncbi:MAG: sigma factor-like helix-turn-helix DNA-binding protein [Terrimicrobiaceae bacterium]
MKTGWGVRNGNIDLGLAVLGVVNVERKPLTFEEIAEVCGCHRSRIEQIEKQAMRKLRGLLHGRRREWL